MIGAIPVTITLIGPHSGRNITALCSDVSWRSVIPGGYASAQVELNQALDTYSEDLRHYAILRITSGEHGGVLWEGRLEDPSPSASESGQTWSLSAVGLMAHANDIRRPYVAVDTDLGRWGRGAGTKTYVTDSTEDDNDPGPVIGRFGPSLKAAVTTGSTVPPNTTLMQWYYPVLRESGQILAALRGAVRQGPMTGPNASAHRLRFFAFNDFAFTGGFNEIFLDPLSEGTSVIGGAAGFSARRGSEASPAWVDDLSVPVLQWVYTGSSSWTGNTDTWSMWGDRMCLRPQMHTSAGTRVSPSDGSAFNVQFASAAEIVHDLLGSGRLPLFDGPGANIVDYSVTESRIIDQFAYPDPTSPAQLLDDLTKVEPRWYWVVWERNAAGRARFEWVTWPTNVRYEIDATAGLDLTVTTDDVFNAVSVRWKDAMDRIRRTLRTSRARFVPNPDIEGDTAPETEVPLLDDVGLVRESELDLGDNMSSIGLAVKAGDEFIADHAYPRAKGSVTVAQRILDYDTGVMVAPWEILPGCLIKVRGLDVSANLPAAGANGVNVFKVVSTDFDSGSGTATLELDSFAASDWKLLGDLSKNRITRRR